MLSKKRFIANWCYNFNMIARKFFYISIAFLLGGFIAFYFIQSAQLAYSIKIISKDELAIVFNRDIKLKTNIFTEPSFKRSVLTKGTFGVREIRIKSDEDIKGQEIKIEFSYSKFFDKNIMNFSDKISMPLNDEIEKLEIKSMEGFISSRPVLSLKFNNKISGDYNLKTLEYPIFWEREISNNSIKFFTKEDLPPGKEISLNLFDKDILIWTKKFYVADEPKIIDITKKDFYFPGDVVDIYFNKPMNISSNPLNIDALGEGKWISETLFSFKLGLVKPDTSYLVELKNGARSKDGISVIESQKYILKTPSELDFDINYLEEENKIKVSFNQPVNKKDAEFKFLTIPKIDGYFSWNENNLIFNIERLNLETKYTITIPRGIETLFGISNKKSQSFSFVTDPKPFKNNFPLIKTKYKKGGQLATILSILEFYKIKTTEEEILKRMGQFQYERLNDVWGDPRKVFVGNYDDFSGYGAHPNVLARVISSFGIKAIVFTDPNISFLEKESKAGNPIIVFSAEGIDFWKTNDNFSIKAGKNLKAFIISGTFGKNLKGFFLNDAQTGEKYKYINANSMIEFFKIVPGVTDQVIVIK